MSDADELFLTAKQVANRYGKTHHMFLERRLRDDPTFPRPLRIGRLRYFRLSSLQEWERACASRSPDYASRRDA